MSVDSIYWSSAGFMAANELPHHYKNKTTSINFQDVRIESEREREIVDTTYVLLVQDFLVGAGRASSKPSPHAVVIQRNHEELHLTFSDCYISSGL
jgi:hypothetical protein